MELQSVVGVGKQRTSLVGNLNRTKSGPLPTNGLSFLEFDIYKINGDVKQRTVIYTHIFRVGKQRTSLLRNLNRTKSGPLPTNGLSFLEFVILRSRGC